MTLQVLATVLGGLILANLLFVDRVNAQTGPRYSNKRLERPRGTLGQSFDAPVFFGVYGQMGGGFKFEHGQPGFGAIIMFRPGRAASFFNFLNDWNSSLVLQADYQKVSAESRILSGDIIIRRYIREMRDPKNKYSPFFGAGFGGSEVLLPPGSSRPHDQYWSLLVELGQEWNYRKDYLLFVKIQIRRYSFRDFNFSTWSLQAGAGIPLPW